MSGEWLRLMGMQPASFQPVSKGPQAPADCDFGLFGITSMNDGTDTVNINAFPAAASVKDTPQNVNVANLINNIFPMSMGAASTMLCSSVFEGMQNPDAVLTA